MKQTEDKQPGVCSKFYLGSEALGFMSVRIWRKSCSLEKKSGEKQRVGCKGMCGALRVWMIGDINQVPSWPSCQSIAFPLAPLQYNSANSSKQGPKSGAAFEYAWLVSFRLSASVFSKPLQLCTGTCLDGDE